MYSFFFFLSSLESLYEHKSGFMIGLKFTLLLSFDLNPLFKYLFLLLLQGYIQYGVPNTPDKILALMNKVHPTLVS